MTSGESPPPLQRGRGRPALISHASIVETACELGLDGLSMSKVAKKLGVATQSLYRHISSRKELITLCVNHLVGGWDTPADNGETLEEWLYTFAVSTRQFLRSNPGLADEFQSVGPGTPQVVIRTEEAVDRLVQRGYPPLVAFLFIGSIAEATVTSVVRQERFDTGPEAKWNADVQATAAIAEVDSDKIPHIASIIDFLVDTDGDQYFKFFIRSLITGMVATLLTEDQQAT